MVFLMVLLNLDKSRRKKPSNKRRSQVKKVFLLQYLNLKSVRLNRKIIDHMTFMMKAKSHKKVITYLAESPL